MAKALVNQTGRSMGTDTTKLVLSAGQIAFAHKQIEEMFKVYTGKDGLRDTMQKVSKLEQGLSGYIFNIAKESAKLAKGNLEIEMNWFRTMTNEAEAYLRNRIAEKEGLPHKDVQLGGEDGFMKCWPVFKSNIIGAIKAGISAGDFNSEGAMRHARAAKANAARAARQTAAAVTEAVDNHKAQAAAEAATPEGATAQVKQAVDHIKMAPSLKQVIARVVADVGSLSTQSQVRLAQLISKAIEEVTNQQKEKDDQAVEKAA